MPARRSIRQQAIRRHQRRRLVLGVAAAGVAAAAVAFLTTTTAARFLRASGAETLAGVTCPATGSASPSACPRPVHKPSPDGSASRAPASMSSTPAGSPSPTASPTPSAAPTTSATPGSAAATTVVHQVLAQINKARVREGLPRYTLTTGLHHSAQRHTSVMAGGCGLSHQCPGEPSLGARETAAGVPWTTAGENIGEGGPVAGTSAAIAQMALTLTQDMLNEKPPNDGHRQNLLSKAFHHIGIAIVRDKSGTVWMTQDFSN